MLRKKQTPPSAFEGPAISGQNGTPSGGKLANKPSALFSPPPLPQLFREFPEKNKTRMEEEGKRMGTGEKAGKSCPNPSGPPLGRKEQQMQSQGSVIAAFSWQLMKRPVFLRS